MSSHKIEKEIMTTKVSFIFTQLSLQNFMWLAEVGPAALKITNLARTQLTKLAHKIGTWIPIWRKQSQFSFHHGNLIPKFWINAKFAVTINLKEELSLFSYILF